MADPSDTWSLSEEQLLRIGRNALWLENYREAYEALSEYCDRLKKRHRWIPPATLACYGLAVGYAENVREGTNICLEAFSQDRHNASIHFCLARLYVLAGSKRNAVEVITQGLRLSRSHRGLNALRKALGVRQALPIPFLSRQNAVNVRLGRALRKLKGNSTA